MKIRADTCTAIAPDEELGPLPKGLTALVAPIRAKMEEHACTENVMTKLLETLSDEKLAIIAAILSKKSGAQQGERVMQIANAMLEELNTIDECISHLTQLKADLTIVFSDALTNQYHLDKGNGTAVIAIERICTDITGIQTYRKALRKAIAETPGPSEEGRTASSGSSCCIS